MSILFKTRVFFHNKNKSISNRNDDNIKNKMNNNHHNDEDDSNASRKNRIGPNGLASFA